MSRERWIYAGIAATAVLVLAVFFLLAPEDASMSGRSGNSVFDSEFWRGPSGSVELSAGDPYMQLQQRVNPATGKTYSEEEIRRIKYLAGRFPDNRLVPRIESAEEERLRLEQEKRLEQISLSMSAGTAAEKDINDFYEHRRKLLLDRLQLVRFVLEEESTRWGPEVRKQYTRMLKHGQKVLGELDDRRARSLEVRRVRASNKSS